MSRLPRWIRRWRRAGQSTGTVTVVIEADVSGFIAGMQRVSQAVADGRRRRAWAVDRAILREETKWFMRGGLEQCYRTADARDAKVKELAASPLGGPRVAAAFLRGWTDTYAKDHPREPYVLHTVWERGDDAGTPVEVVS